jgi:hypothetical protein
MCIPAGILPMSCFFAGSVVCEELRKQAREGSLCVVILNQTKCLLASTGDFG